MVVDKIDGGFVVALAVGFFEMVVGVGFSWWFLAWVSLGGSCSGCFFVGLFFFFLRNFCGCCW